MKERWVEAPRITGNEELARKFGVSPMAMRLIRSRAGESEEEVREILRRVCGAGIPVTIQGSRTGLAAAAALYHDAPEILTGDLPTPIKYYSPDIRDAYKRVEEVSADKLAAMLPEELRGAFAPLLREDYDPDTRALVKAADKFSAYIKCVEELKAGNAEFRQAAEQTLEALKGYGLPEVDYFMDRFLPAFGLTLDELS